MSSWTLTKYATRNWSDYNHALKQRGSLEVWFDLEVDWTAMPTGSRGRQPLYSDAAIQACLLPSPIKVQRVRYTCWLAAPASKPRAKAKASESRGHVFYGRTLPRADLGWVDTVGSVRAGGEILRSHERF